MVTDDQITATIKQKFALFQQKRRETELLMAQIQGIAEAADLKAEEVNAILGVDLFSDTKPNP